MSGGSYDYFSVHAPEKLRGIQSDLASMAIRCLKRAKGETERNFVKEDGSYNTNAKDMVDLAALAEAGDFLDAIASKVGGIARIIEGLESVTHQIEWWASGDSGIDSVVHAWRKATKPSNTKAPTAGFLALRRIYDAQRALMGQLPVPAGTADPDAERWIQLGFNSGVNKCVDLVVAAMNEDGV